MIKKDVLKKIIDEKKYIFLFLISLIIIFFSGFTALKNNNIKPANIWDGYVVLLVEKESDSHEIMEMLNSIPAFDEIISKKNTLVEYSNYYSLEYDVLENLENRFNPADPRITLYLTGLSRYFQADIAGKSSAVYYIKTELPGIEAKKAIERVFPDTINWIIPGNAESFFSNKAPLAVFIIILSAFVFFSRKYALLYIAVSSLWFFLVKENSIIFFYPSVLMFILLFYLTGIKDIVVKKYIETGKIEYSVALFNRLFIILPLFLAVVYVIAAAEKFTITNYITIFSAFIFAAGCVSAILFYDLHKASYFFHNVFCNIIIHPAGINLLFENLKKIKPLYFFTLIYTLSIFTLPAFITHKSPDIIMPAPYRIIESGITFENLGRLSVNEKSYMFLPDFSDYIKHLAYQIRLPYETSYEMPEKGETITVSNYKYNNDNYVNNKKIVTRFTENWLMDIIVKNRDNGIIGLMINDRGIIQSAVMDSFTPAVRIIFPVIFIIFYPIIIFLMFRSGNNIKIYNWKAIIPVIRRRKQQAA